MKNRIVDNLAGTAFPEFNVGRCFNIPNASRQNCGCSPQGPVVL